MHALSTGVVVKGYWGMLLPLHQWRHNLKNPMGYNSFSYWMRYLEAPKGGLVEIRPTIFGEDDMGAERDARWDLPILDRELTCYYTP